MSTDMWSGSVCWGSAGSQRASLWKLSWLAPPARLPSARNPPGSTGSSSSQPSVIPATCQPKAERSQPTAPPHPTKKKPGGVKEIVPLRGSGLRQNAQDDTFVDVALTAAGLPPSLKLRRDTRPSALSLVPRLSPRGWSRRDSGAGGGEGRAAGVIGGIRLAAVLSVIPHDRRPIRRGDSHRLLRSRSD